MALYQLAAMGAPTPQQASALEAALSGLVEPFGLRLGHEIGWSVQPAAFAPDGQEPAAVAYFGAAGFQDAAMAQVLPTDVSVLPVISEDGRVHDEIPEGLRRFNCMTYATDGPHRIAVALLECVGLLPRQRRVFVSYRRDSARGAALQLFNSLSAKQFDVFLDTHGIAAGEDFQAMLWHRLCDSDVLIMLDTPDYFASRWTAAEYGRALAKNISIMRIGWPTVAPSPLTEADVDAATGQLSDQALSRIAVEIEAIRAQSHAVRHLNLFSKIRQAVECVGGTISGVGVHNTVHLTLADGTEIAAHPTVGIPTSMTLQEAVERSSGRAAAVVYDHLGVHRHWMQHIRWLGENIRAARWLKASELAWDLGGWGSS
jgi:hypothetical protein